MITRDLTITVKNDTASLSEPVTLYRGDRGIVLNCKIMQYKFKFNRTTLENVINNETSIMGSRVLVHKPEGKGCFEIPFAEVDDDVVVITITSNWLDEMSEIGTYKLQIQLYGEDPKYQRVTIPPVEFVVKDVLCNIDEYFDDNGALVGYAESDISTVEVVGSAYNADLSQGYERTDWAIGDVITSTSLNKMEEAIEYSIEQLAEHTHEGMVTSSSCSRIEFVTAYPDTLEPGVLYVLVEEK